MIELAKANPDVETLKLSIWVAVGVIAILLSIVAFFLQKTVKVQEILVTAVNQLTTAVTVIQKQQEERDPRTERRLNDHAKRLDNHQNRLSILETRCIITHKRDE